MVETARDIVSDLGPECRRVLVGKHALSLPVKTSQLKDFDHIPILRIRDWFDFFLTHSCLHLLCGLQQPHPKREADILTCFWENFRALRPRHEIFQRASEGRLVLSQTFPLLVHGDEGRGRKHAAHFVMSFHPVLGMGFKKKEKSTSWAKMECNFSGHTYTNRFLIATMRKRDYSDQNVETWNALMEEVAAEAAFMADDGVVASNGLRFWGVVLGIVGDWPFLHKSGGFCRSFNNIQKRKTQKNLPVGICHLCQGGQRPYPFEQLETRRPLWRSTMFAEDPFVLPNPLAMSLLHEPGKEASLWCFDWFHTMHLGVLRNFIGSVLALLSDEEPQSNVDLRFAALSARYRRWCHSNSRRAHITKLTKESIGWEKTTTFPSAIWHKGALSTVVMDFLEARFAEDTFAHQPLLQMASEACNAIQRCARILYRSEVWLSPSVCKLVSELGFQFLRRYSQMASLANSQNRCLFVFQPKIHCLHHFKVELMEAHQANVKGLNPMALSCQQSEDFIGRPARLSRRVTAQRPVLHRIMDRYLQATYHMFLQNRILIRPTWLTVIVGWRFPQVISFKWLEFFVNHHHQKISRNVPMK